MQGLFQSSSATRPSYIKGAQDLSSALTGKSPNKYSNIDTFNIESVRSKAQWKYEDLSSRDKKQAGSLFDFSSFRSNTNTSSDDQSNFKYQSRIQSTLMNTQKEYGDPHMASPSKLFQIKDKIQTIGGSTFDSAAPKTSLTHNKRFSLSNSLNEKNLPADSILSLSKRDTSKSFMGKRMDSMVPYEFLVELSRKLDNCDEQMIHTLSQPYVNELLKLSTTITRTLKNLPQFSHKL